MSIACVFPGQGSQYVGMMNDLARDFPFILDLYAEASAAIGYDLWHLIQQGPESQLNQTEHTQVAMLVSDVAVYRILQQETSLRPQMMAGHSLGEYAALVAADAINLAEAAALVKKRGQLMQDNVPLGLGAMAAIVGLDDQVVATLCQKASDGTFQVSPANYNAIGQVVIAGHTPAVEAALKLAEEQGARMAIKIPVSVPCHCSLLLPAAKQFHETLQQTPFKVPAIPVLSNVDLSAYQSAEQIRHLLETQLYSPVRWVETIQKMRQAGVELVIECGPGKILQGLIKRIDKSILALSVNDGQSLDNAKRALNG